MRKTASRQQHSLTGGDGNKPSANLRLGSNHRVPFYPQPSDRCRGDDIHAAIEAGRRQTSHQRIARRQTHSLTMDHAITQCPCHQPRNVEKGFEAAASCVEVAKILDTDLCTEKRRNLQRPTQTLRIFAERLGVECPCHDGAAAGFPAWMMGMVIGNPLEQQETES